MFEVACDKPIPIDEMGTWPKTVHVFEDTHVWAIKAAMAAQRPLLIKGEPGTGKSQLARAVAFQTNRAFISTVVNAQTEGQDLLWHYDPVARLGEAQALGNLKKTIDEVKNTLDHLNFLSPGPLWWAFNWSSASDRAVQCKRSTPLPIQPSEWGGAWDEKDGSVVLIDEIDKAESDLPNSLLETLGNGAFQVPYLAEKIGLKQGQTPPLIVVTTNEERELPKAFIRRCMVLEMRLPKNESDLLTFLIARGEAHFPGRCSEDVRTEAAQQLIQDRKNADKYGRVAPGQAEYLDLLQAVIRLAEEKMASGSAENRSLDKEQRDILAKIKNFALQK